MPLATDIPAQSQPLIRDNFNSIVTLIDVDHVDFGVNNDYGKHNKVTFPRQAAPPVAGNAEVILFSALSAGSGQTELYFKNEGAGGIITNCTESGNTWGYLPNGLLIKFGSSTQTGYDRIVGFGGPNFSVAPFAVYVTVRSDLTGTDTTAADCNVMATLSGKPITTTQFMVNCFQISNRAAATVSFKWYAIGLP